MSVITNTEIKQLQDYTFDEVGTFSIDQLAGVAMDRQFTPVTNGTKVLNYETFDTLTTTFDTEVRTFDEMGTIMDNTSHRNLGSYTVDELATFTFDQIGGVSFDRQFSPITNISKPA